MEHRINFGNGQVSRTMNYAEARRELVALRNEMYSTTYRIQRYAGDGEWVGIGAAGRLETSERKGL